MTLPGGGGPKSSKVDGNNDSVVEMDASSFSIAVPNDESEVTVSTSQSLEHVDISILDSLSDELMDGLAGGGGLNNESSIDESSSDELIERLASGGRPNKELSSSSDDSSSEELSYLLHNGGMPQMVSLS
jgi:hypothetical protein